MREQHVPGAAIGIVKDGKVIYAKGYGVRELKSKQPVTAKTLFAMGSVTKSFTALAVASVIDEGKLDWDKPVREYLPWFRMFDPVATELITVRDMLTHRSGLPRHDFIRFSTHLSREELVRRVRYLEPNKTFRDVYQYNNLMFVTAGFLAGHQAGTTWEELVRTRIYQPVGMTLSTTSVVDSQKSADFARPHSGGEEEKFYVYQTFGVGPNGAVNSCVDDMLKYLRMWLDGGTAQGRTVISKKQFTELWRPVTVVNSTASYAPGWQIGSYRGHASVSHGGSITGFRANVLLLPQERIGIVAMINDETGLAGTLTDRAADLILNLPPAPRPGNRTAASRQRASAQSAEGAPPAKKLEEYAGVYEHPAYGRVAVRHESGGLSVRFDALSLNLRHQHYETFQSSQGPVRFVLNEKGQVAEMHLPLEAAVKPLVFLKSAKP